MTTMTDKLLAKAVDYEEKARALRFAAAEMNGDAVVTKQKTAVGTLEAAIALRKAQSNGHGNHAVVTDAERLATVRAVLEAADGPQRIQDIHDELASRGQACARSWLYKALHTMSGVRMIGHSNQTRWGLGRKPKRSRETIAAADQAVRARMAEVLTHYSHKTPKAPAEVAGELNLTVVQTGLGPLVNSGYLKKRRGGYIRTAKRYVIDENATKTE